MKKWEKIEDKFNLSLINRYETIVQKIKKSAQKAKSTIRDFVKKLFNLIIPIVKKIKDQAIQISTIDPKSILKQTKEIIKQITFKNFIRVVKSPPYKKMGIFFKRNSISILFCIFFSVGIYKTIESIIDLLPAKKNSRSIASEEDTRERPNYYLLNKKHLKIENIRIPVSLNDKKRIATIIADLVIECPNRTTQQFLFNSPHLVQDKLNNTIAPQINTFPLTEEGKVILRKKIKLELTELLKENHFKLFQIKRVNIVQVTAS